MILTELTRRGGRAPRGKKLCGNGIGTDGIALRALRLREVDLVVILTAAALLLLAGWLLRSGPAQGTTDIFGRA